MSDVQSAWSPHSAGEDAPSQAGSSLLEPARWIEPDALDVHDRPDGAERSDATADGVAPVDVPAPDDATGETLAELARRADERPEGGTPDNSVRTLRALLLGDNAPDYEARLAAIERRLDALAAERASAPRGESVAPPALERRLDALAKRVDQIYDSARAADVTVNSLAQIRRELDDVRLEQATLSENAAEQMRQADARCRLRQRRARGANRMELQRLRRRVYARAGAFRADNPAFDMTAYRDAGRSVPALMEDTGRAPRIPIREMTAGTAFRAVGRSTLALVLALLTLIVVVVRLGAQGIGAAGQYLMAKMRRE
jgi:hypothetical protein